VNQTQSIIVYHNPAQQAFWEGGYAVPIGAGLGVGFLLFLALMWVAGKVSRGWRGPSDLTMAGAAIASLGVGFLVFNYLML
jgi:hypothetical protein